MFNGEQKKVVLVQKECEIWSKWQKIKNGLEQIVQKWGSNSNLANGTLSITLFLQ